MLLLIDNYDSFVYNLSRYLVEMGCETVVVRNDAMTVDEVRKLQPQAVLCSPGPCTPRDAGVCVELVQQLGSTIPIRIEIRIGRSARSLRLTDRENPGFWIRPRASPVPPQPSRLCSVLRPEIGRFRVGRSARSLRPTQNWGCSMTTVTSRRKLGTGCTMSPETGFSEGKPRKSHFSRKSGNNPHSHSAP